MNDLAPILTALAAAAGFFALGWHLCARSLADVERSARQHFESARQIGDTNAHIAAAGAAHDQAAAAFAELAKDVETNTERVNALFTAMVANGVLRTTAEAPSGVHPRHRSNVAPKFSIPGGGGGNPAESMIS